MKLKLQAANSPKFPYVIHKDDGVLVGALRNKEDGELIVRAVNNLESLQKELEYVLKVIEDSENWWMTAPNRGGFDADKINDVLQRSKI